MGKSNKEAGGWDTEGKRWDKGIFVCEEKKNGKVKWKETQSQENGHPLIKKKNLLVVKSSNL